LESQSRPVTLESFPLTDSIFVEQPSVPILMYDKHGKYTVMTLEQLLPMSFGPDKLLSTEELAQNAAASN
jgi:hypothetical protein